MQNTLKHIDVNINVYNNYSLENITSYDNNDYSNDDFNYDGNIYDGSNPRLFNELFAIPDLDRTYYFNCNSRQLYGCKFCHIRNFINKCRPMCEKIKEISNFELKLLSLLTYRESIYYKNYYSREIKYNILDKFIDILTSVNNILPKIKCDINDTYSRTNNLMRYFHKVCGCQCDYWNLEKSNNSDNCGDNKKPIFVMIGDDYLKINDVPDFINMIDIWEKLSDILFQYSINKLEEEVHDENYKELCKLYNDVNSSYWNVLVSCKLQTKTRAAIEAYRKSLNNLLTMENILTNEAFQIYENYLCDI
jgi:hypothetical protein